MKYNIVIVLSLFAAISTVDADDTTTSPRVIVNATLEDRENTNDTIFTGAYLHYEMIESSYHAESQRSQPHLANRKQIVSLLQSEVIRIGGDQLAFTSLSGDKLSIEDVKRQLTVNPLALMLPHGATIHPQLALALKADTVVVSRIDRRSRPLRLVPRPSGG